MTASAPETTTTTTTTTTPQNEQEGDHTPSRNNPPTHPLVLCKDFARFRTDGSITNSYRSIEHVLMSTSCVTNRHLRRLTNVDGAVKKEKWAEHFINLLVVDERCANIACHTSKSLKKELVEGVSIIERLEHLLVIVARRGKHCTIDAETGKGLLLLDLCSGKGIAGTMVAVRFPEAKIVGVDIRPPSPTERHLHDGFLPNHIRRTGNLYDHSLLHDIVTKEMPPEGCCLLLGTHLCGDLSRVAIDLFDRYPDRMAAAVIAPCCLQRKKAPIGSISYSGNDWGYDTTDVARRQGIDPFALWLHRLWDRASVPDNHKDLFRDKDMLTTKNVYLLISRFGPHRTDKLKGTCTEEFLVCQQVSSCAARLERMNV